MLCYVTSSPSSLILHLNIHDWTTSLATSLCSHTIQSSHFSRYGSISLILRHIFVILFIVRSLLLPPVLFYLLIGYLLPASGPLWLNRDPLHPLVPLCGVQTCPAVRFTILSGCLSSSFRQIKSRCFSRGFVALRVLQKSSCYWEKRFIKLMVKYNTIQYNTIGPTTCVLSAHQILCTFLNFVNRGSIKYV